MAYPPRHRDRLANKLGHIQSESHLGSRSRRAGFSYRTEILQAFARRARRGTSRGRGFPCVRECKLTPSPEYRELPGHEKPGPRAQILLIPRVPCELLGFFPVSTSRP